MTPLNDNAYWEGICKVAAHTYQDGRVIATIVAEVVHHGLLQMHDVVKFVAGFPVSHR